MQKQITFRSPFIIKLRLVALSAALLFLIVGAARVHADKYDEQINALNQQNSASQSALGGLQTEAGSYQEAIAQLQGQIDAVQAALTVNTNKQAETQAAIVAAQQKIDQERAYLKESIKTMYVDGQLSTVEQLATSKNLSDYVDKEEYQNSVENKIDATIKEIAVQQENLKKQKAELDVLIATQKQQNEALANARGQQQQMLAYNESQQNDFNSKIAANSGKIQELRKAQIVANARFIPPAGSGGGYGGGSACGGGYPGVWCNAGQDTIFDSWGMYNRECVSYTAYRVAASGRYMPAWGSIGAGNANQWDDNARAAGIPVDGTPQAGDVAISNNGYYGHAMYVESVNGDGTFNLSQYNASLNGTFSTRSGVNPAGLSFIHF
ncbi:MAG: CHAP domain-containing protein [Patescibacteria group bacterium]|nr:CHAP domain-containing protein [Patescibacteria group bacterium]